MPKLLPIPFPDLEIKPRKHWLPGKCIHSCSHVQDVVLSHLVKWLSSALYALQIDGAVMSGNIGQVLWKICTEICYKVHTFCGIILAPRRYKSWQPKLPMSNYLWTILPLYGFPQVHVQKTQVKKASVKLVHWIVRSCWHDCAVS